MAPIIASVVFFLLGFSLAAPAKNAPSSALSGNLNPACAPGGNFQLDNFSLQLPTGSKGKVDQISASQLSGCKGWQKKQFFFTGNDGALVMKVPDRSTCVTTPNSKHCRTELRENSPRSWDPKKSINRLVSELVVIKADDSKYGTVVGQIHVDDKVSKKPVCELFVNKQGVVTMGVEQVPNTSSLKMTKVGKIDIGKKFSYEIRYEKGKLSVGINGGAPKILGTGSLNSPLSYFKAGNYNQGNSPSEVHFYKINIRHS